MENKMQQTISELVVIGFFVYFGRWGGVLNKANLELSFHNRHKPRCEKYLAVYVKSSERLEKPNCHLFSVLCL